MPPTSKRVANAETLFWAAAGLLFACVLTLGALVADRLPTRLDVEAVALRGQAPAAARFFTLLGRWPILAGLSLCALLGAIVWHHDLISVALLVVAQPFAQLISTALKYSHRRTRPDYFLGAKEPDHSYPSGHSATAIVFYVGFAILIARTPAIPTPLAAAAIGVLAICAAAIPWSRLALGAHYLTDVIGGLIFGSACLCLCAALALHLGVSV